MTLTSIAKVTKLWSNGMLDGGGWCKVAWSRWRGGEVGMEWWHYLETESFYRNISGSSVTRPHCAHRHQLGHTPPCTLTGSQEPGSRGAFPRRKRIQAYIYDKPVFKVFIHHSISFQSKTKDCDRVWK